MSALLNASPKPGGAVATTDSVLAPDHFTNGLPYDADGTLSVTNLGTIDHYHQGLPFTALGRICTALNSPVADFGSGAAPFNAGGLLVIGSGGVDHVSSGVPYTASQRIWGA
jgi:hypothetical protein